MNSRLFLILALLTSCIYSQSYQTVVIEDESANNEIDSLNKEEIESAAKEIVAQIGLPQNFVLKADVSFKNNARAEMITGNDSRIRRYVTYDPNFFDKINEDANNKWAAISILAHEIGHHLNNHSLNNDGSTYAYELEADKWSGFVLRKMGASLKDAQSAIATLKERKKPSKTHPPKQERLLSIEKGWRSGQADLDKFTAEEDITSTLVKNKYTKAIGWINSSSIQSISYEEHMVPDEEIEISKMSNNYVDILYGYGKYQIRASDSLGFIKTSMEDGTSYMLKEDNYYFKKKKEAKNKGWNKGYHPYMENIYFELEEIEVAHNVRPVIGDIFQEINLNSFKDSLKFNKIKTVNGIPSYELEITQTCNRLLGKKKSISIKINIKKYYDIESGLLHFSEEKIEQSDIKKGRVINKSILTSKILIEDYFLESEILMPHKFLIKKSLVKNGKSLPEITQQRIISKVEINPKFGNSLFLTETE